MSYIYHRVPSQLQGTTLYPLNELRNINPILYAAEIKKYEGRDWIVKSQICPFDCMWNDVLFFSPADPMDIRRALNEAGVEFSPMRFFRVPAERLDPKQTVVLRYRRSRKENRMYEAYDMRTLSQFSHVTRRTVQGYKEQVARGQNPPLIFAHIFHVLYKGTLNIADLPIVEV